MLRYILSFALSIILTRIVIIFKDYIQQPISQFLPTHTKKAGTPTMGGLAIFTSFLLAHLYYPINSAVLWIYYVGSICFLVGLVDDITKVVTKNNRGLSKMIKFSMLAPGILLCLLLNLNYTNYWLLPIHLGAILGASACYDIVDGLDGLVGLIGLCVLITNAILFPEGYRLLMILSGSILGFLVFNLKPARIFMGDSGAMLIGGVAGGFFVHASLNPLLILTSIVPIIDGLSVGLKLICIYLGIKAPKMIAPIHHYFENRFGEGRTVQGLALITALSCILAITISEFFAYIS